MPDHARFRGAAGDAPEFTDLGPSDWSLTFDTETLTDASQRLRIGTYQVRRGESFVQAGVFLDPEVLTPSEIETVHQHADARGWRVRTLTDFVDDVFYPLALELGGLVIRSDLPFDISRLAIAHGPAKSPGGRMRGGFSFRLSDNPSCVQAAEMSPSEAGRPFPLPHPDRLPEPITSTPRMRTRRPL